MAKVVAGEGETAWLPPSLLPQGPHAPWPGLWEFPPQHQADPHALFPPPEVCLKLNSGRSVSALLSPWPLGLPIPPSGPGLQGKRLCDQGWPGLDEVTEWQECSPGHLVTGHCHGGRTQDLGSVSSLCPRPMLCMSSQ